VVEFWEACRSARLFVDVDYGQWGLHFLSPSASAARTHSLRPDEFKPHDVVLAEFLGDSELLVVTAASDVLVALPLDPRRDWNRAADSIDAFLVRYFTEEGRKYWEPVRTS
jgi:hypothetical protein